MDLGLKGLNAVVTGGTKGIGRAIAGILADEGANVAVCARQQVEIDDAIESLRARDVKAFGAALDVGDASALKTWIAGPPSPSAASTSWSPM